MSDELIDKISDLPEEQASAASEVDAVDSENIDTLQLDSDSSGYKIKITNFDGPLDLLLHLIKAAKIDIKDIFVSEITEQYLEYIKDIGMLDLERASEFIEVAATLIEIKSRALLPKIEELMTEEVEDDGSRLIRQLEEYQMFKELSEKMKKLENTGHLYRAPDESVGDYRVVLKQMTLEGLLNAFSRLLTKVETKKQHAKPRHIKKDPYTVADKIEHILRLVFSRKEMSFFELFDEDYNKSEVITSFQALLELMKLQLVHVEQSGTFEDIMICGNPEGASAIEGGIDSLVSEIRRTEFEGERSSEISSEDEESDEGEDEEFKLSVPFEDEL